MSFIFPDLRIKPGTKTKGRRKSKIKNWITLLRSKSNEKWDWPQFQITKIWREKIKFTSSQRKRRSEESGCGRKEGRGEDKGGLINSFWE